MGQEQITTNTLDSEGVRQDRAEGGGGGKTATGHTWKRKWAQAFLAALEKRGIVLDACEAVGIGTRTAYDYREQDPLFARAWDQAIRDSLGVYERELYRRAVEGNERPVYHGGKQVGVIREYSDNLLMFRIKRIDPLYREAAKIDVAITSDKPDGFEYAIANPAVVASLREVLQSARYTRLEELEPSAN